jgi:hypothetical protein
VVEAIHRLAWKQLVKAQCSQNPDFPVF